MLFENVVCTAVSVLIASFIVHVRSCDWLLNDKQRPTVCIIISACIFAFKNWARLNLFGLFESRQLQRLRIRVRSAEAVCSYNSICACAKRDVSGVAWSRHVPRDDDDDVMLVARRPRCGRACDRTSPDCFRSPTTSGAVWVGATADREYPKSWSSQTQQLRGRFTNGGLHWPQTLAD